jgi:hypothetical protein
MTLPRLTAPVALLVVALCAAAKGTGASDASGARIVPLPAEVRARLEPLGPDVVGEALAAAPIDDPARLRHLEPGTWRYRILAGANRGHEQIVHVERVASSDPGTAWRVVDDDGEIQQLRVTTDHEVVKLSQTDLQSDRTVVYRPGLVLEPGMQVGESKTVKRALVTHKMQRPEDVEFEGELEYTTRYVGMYRVTVPAGRFDARLLEHRYSMKIGPAKARYHSYGFYADGVGNVAEASEESVSALLVYRRSSSGARVLLPVPVD